MQVTEQTKKESLQLLSIFKGRVLNPFKTDKWQTKLTDEISTMLSDFKMRERFNVGEQIKNQYTGFIPTPKATLSNRLRFLFLGDIK
jgi:hypothetical protein